MYKTIVNFKLKHFVTCKSGYYWTYRLKNIFLSLRFDHISSHLHRCKYHLIVKNLNVQNSIVWLYSIAFAIRFIQVIFLTTQTNKSWETTVWERSEVLPFGELENFHSGFATGVGTICPHHRIVVHFGFQSRQTHRRFSSTHAQILICHHHYSGQIFDETRFIYYSCY